LLKKHWRDGTTTVVMTKAVLVPRRVEPKGAAGGCQLGARGGVEGPASAEAAACEAVQNVAVAALQRQEAGRRVRARPRVPHGCGRPRGGRLRYSRVQLLERAFGIEVLVCPESSVGRPVLAAIHDPESIARVLGSMGLPLVVPEQAGCRAPPLEEEFDSGSECVPE
jgi:hypothetical protein